MSKRLDIHRPSVITPEDYSFVAIVFHGEDLGTALCNAEERKRLRLHMEKTGGKFSTHAHGGTCHICGAWAATVAYFHHHPTNSYIVTGETCCGKLEDGHASRFRAIRDEATAILKAKAGKMKAKGLLIEMGLEKGWEIYDAYASRWAAEDAGWEEGVIWDIVSKFVRYGSISEKAEAFLKSLLEKIDNREDLKAKWAAETASALPVPVTEDRIEVTGEVLSLKWKETMYGTALKTVIKHADGWKVYGTLPKALIDNAEVGDIVTFTAKITVSDDDTKFGFFSRPTKASLVTKKEEAA